MKADSEAKETGRVEAFSDGVFAIAITLLGFTFRVPSTAGAHLATALAASWPELLAFVTSFTTIGILWINHHRLFTHIRKVNHSLLLLNGFLLMTITMVPAATIILSDYLGHPGARTAAVVYSGLFVLVTISFNLLWRYSSRRLRLLDSSVDQRTIRRINLQYGFGPLAYLMSAGIAFANVWASLTANIVFAAFFALPALDWGDRAPPSNEDRT